MLEQIARLVIALSGLWIIYVGVLMLLTPHKALIFLSKAGSTNLINYTELSLRLVWGVALWFYAAYSSQTQFLHILGLFAVISSILLLSIPKQWHAAFAHVSAKQIRPGLVPWLSPFAFSFGCFLLYCVS